MFYNVGTIAFLQKEASEACQSVVIKYCRWLSRCLVLEDFFSSHSEKQLAVNFAGKLLVHSSPLNM